MTTSRRDGPTVDREELKAVLLAKGKPEYWAGIKAAASGLTVLLHEYQVGAFGATPPDAAKYEAALAVLSTSVLATMPAATAPTAEECKGVCNLLVQACRARVSTTETAAMVAAGATTKGGTTLDVGRLVKAGNAQRDGAHLADDKMCAHSVVRAIHEGLTADPRCLAALGDVLKVPSLTEERSFRAARARDEDADGGSQQGQLSQKGGANKRALGKVNAQEVEARGALALRAAFYAGSYQPHAVEDGGPVPTAGYGELGGTGAKKREMTLRELEAHLDSWKSLCFRAHNGAHARQIFEKVWAKATDHVSATVGRPRLLAYALEAGFEHVLEHGVPFKKPPGNPSPHVRGDGGGGGGGGKGQQKGKGKGKGAPPAAVVYGTDRGRGRCRDFDRGGDNPNGGCYRGAARCRFDHLPPVAGGAPIPAAAADPAAAPAAMAAADAEV
jgi:hypothetical protein